MRAALGAAVFLAGALRIKVDRLVERGGGTGVVSVVSVVSVVTLLSMIRGLLWPSNQPLKLVDEPTKGTPMRTFGPGGAGFVRVDP